MEDKNFVARRLRSIVEICYMPHHFQTELLSSCILWLAGECDLGNHIDAVANIRLSLPEDYQDASAALAGWIDCANELLASEPKVVEVRHRCPIDMPPCPECEALQDDEDFNAYGGS
jgi:hypothetical protein